MRSQLRCKYSQRLMGSILDFPPVSPTINQLRVQQNSLHPRSARWEWHFEVSINQHIHSPTHFSPKCAFCTPTFDFPQAFCPRCSFNYVMYVYSQSAPADPFSLFSLFLRCLRLFNCLPVTNCKYQSPAAAALSLSCSFPLSTAQ